MEIEVEEREIHHFWGVSSPHGLQRKTVTISWTMFWVLWDYFYRKAVYDNLANGSSNKK